MRRPSCGHYGLEVFDESRLKVTLIEAGPRILPALPEKLAEAAHEELEALGVRVITGEQVVEATPDGMITKSGELIKADLRVWAAGVKGPDMLANLGAGDHAQQSAGGQARRLQTTRDDRIFAIGDCAYFVPQGESRPVPPRAQAAHQMAAIAFHNLKAMIRGKPLKTFVYRDHGSLVSLSHFSTVGIADGQPDRRAHGDRGPAGAFCLYLALPHAPDRHSRLAQGPGADPARPCQPDRPAAVEVALTCRIYCNRR